MSIKRKKKEKAKRQKKDQFLKTFSENAALGIAAVCTQDVDYLIPVKIIVWQGGGFNTNVSEAFAVQLLEEANNRYASAGSGIQFYLVRSPHFRTNAGYADGIQSDQEAVGMFATEYNDNHISIHIVGATDEFVGSALLPSTPYLNKSLWIRTTGDAIDFTNPIPRLEQVGGTLAHELGHTLGLQHTHAPGRFLSDIQFNSNGAVTDDCYQEAVSRVKQNYWYNGCVSTNNELKCEINGDQLCDTEADPNMNWMDNLDDPDEDNGCVATISEAGGTNMMVDNWGATWAPNALNIMAYNNRRCRNFFSQGQIGVMEHYLDGDFNNLPLNIVGPATVACNANGIFSIPAVFGATYDWEVSAGATIISGDGTNTVTIRGVTGAAGASRIISVTVSSNHVDFCLTKTFNTGKPIVASISGPATMTSGAIAYFSVSATNATSYNWNVSGPGWVVNSISGAGAYIKAGFVDGIVIGSATNSCGTSDKYTYVMITEGGGGGCVDPFAMVAQNPAEEEIVLQVVQPDPDPCLSMGSMATDAKTNQYKVRLYNSQEAKVLEQSLEIEDRASINVSHLPKGLYVIHIESKKTLRTARIMLE